MHRAIHSQADGKGDARSRAASIDFPTSEDRARQEFAAESDINELLRRYGVGALSNRVPTYGEVDHDLDLHTALNAIREADDAFRRLPNHLRQKYATWDELLAAAERGEVHLEEKPTNDAPGAAPSDPQPGTTTQPGSPVPANS